jgi:hypothetical protein
MPIITYGDTKPVNRKTGVQSVYFNGVKVEGLHLYTTIPSDGPVQIYYLAYTKEGAKFLHYTADEPSEDAGFAYFKLDLEDPNIETFIKTYMQNNKRNNR